MGIIFALATPVGQSPICVFRVTGQGYLTSLHEILDSGVDKGIGSSTNGVLFGRGLSLILLVLFFLNHLQNLPVKTLSRFMLMEVYQSCPKLFLSSKVVVSQRLVLVSFLCGGFFKNNKISWLRKLNP